MNLEIPQSLQLDADNILKHIYEINMKKNLNSFPLLMKKREVKRFKTNYNNFWTRLITVSENIVFETKVLENIIKALAVFSK